MPETQQRPAARTDRAGLILARVITEGLAPTVLVGVLLLAQPLLTPGATWLQAVTAVVFTVGLPFALVLVLKHRGAITDHHVRVREHRAPILVASAASLGLGALLLASAVGWSRVRLGAHTPGQVLGGHVSAA
ncbi:hypothetical protein GM708_05735 [Vibrio cholerae]|nr:hypothetical protein [Vibrio cholerae]